MSNLKKLVYLIFVLLLASLFSGVASAQVDTDTAFALTFGTGESFNIQDDYRVTTYTFNVLSGTLAGTATLTVTPSLGTFVITATATGSFRIINYDPSTSVYLDSALYVRGATISLSVGQTLTITWKDITTVVVGDGELMNLYFRSDSYTTLGVTAYGLDTDYTNIDTTITSTATGSVGFEYGFRVWLVDSATVSTELTSGSPEGVISLVSNTTGYQTSTWNCVGEEVVFGYQALKIGLYERQGGSGDWTLKASYLSNVLLTKYLTASTWTFRLYVDYATGTATTSSFSFGSSSYRSGIYNFVYLRPLPSELGWWRLSQGDLIGFILGSYIDIIGEAFYVFILFGIAASMYRRYGHLGPIAFFFTVFGGVGGIVWLFVPLWAALVVATFTILICTFIVWRIIR